MRTKVLQHVPYEGLGSMRRYLERRGADIEFVHLWRGDPLPALSECDLLIAMGGPMSVTDFDQHDWLRAETDFIAEAIQTDKPVLGVCLGAQLIAQAMGARVDRNRQEEIGWFEVQGMQAPGCFGFPSSFPAFHWHGDTYALPPGAVQLARSAACEQQAFQLGRRVIGLQFHLETTHQTMNGLIERLGGDLQPGPTVQSAERMRAEPAESFHAIHELMGELLDYLCCSDAAEETR